MKYPDYVKQYRPKGTVVKKVNDTYYAYYATSKRVPGKNYPVQEIKGLAGKIDRWGFHPLSRALVDTEHVVIRECGFTNFLLKFEEEYISRRSGPVKERRDLYYSMIVYLSNNSYLNDRNRRDKPFQTDRDHESGRVRGRKSGKDPAGALEYRDAALAVGCAIKGRPENRTERRGHDKQRGVKKILYDDEKI